MGRKISNRRHPCKERKMIKEPLKRAAPSAQHLRCRETLLAVARRQMGDMPAEEVLAVFAYTLGQMTILQDRKRFTSAEIMEVVTRNIQQGNRDAATRVFSAEGSTRPLVCAG
jgi:hypothetical protein